jgi:predicted enzyme involved in methoxymalonyl-ACP biosynthesis
MSCRVLRRDVEKFMLDCLVEAARASGVSKIRGEYIPTEKNGLVADLFPGLGFAEMKSAPGRSFYELDVKSVRGPLSTAIVREEREISFVPE